MISSQGLAIGLLAAGFALFPATQNNIGITGQWSLTPAQDSDRVQMTVHWRNSGHSMNSTVEWSLDRLEGLSAAQFKSPGISVQFRLSREAGAFHCEGYLKGGSGGGIFTFAVNRSFGTTMAALGFKLTDEQVFAMAMHDVTTAYVKGIRAEGIQVNTVDKLLSIRIHDVTPEFARDLNRLGYSSVSTDQLIAMRIHGVTPGFIQKLQGRGMKNLSIDQLLSLRIHGIAD